MGKGGKNAEAASPAAAAPKKAGAATITGKVDKKSPQQQQQQQQRKGGSGKTKTLHITEKSIRKLGWRAGMARFEPEVFPFARAYIHKVLTALVRAAIVRADGRRHKTLRGDDAREAMRLIGLSVVARTSDREGTTQA